MALETRSRQPSRKGVRSDHRLSPPRSKAAALSISYSTDAGVGALVIDHGPGNRIDGDFIEQLGRAADQASRSAARVVVVTATGPDFSHGGHPTLFADKDLLEIRAMIRGIEQAFALVESLPVPTVAAVQGRAFGGGFELALRADFVLAEPDASFWFPEATVGLLPLAGGAQRLAARVGTAIATRLILTADETPATELAAVGALVATPPGALVEHTQVLAARLAAGPTQAYAGTKAVLAAWTRSGMAAADEVMVDHAARLFATEDVSAAARQAPFVGR